MVDKTIELYAEIDGSVMNTIALAGGQPA
jgi:hypothetical protein